MDSNFLALLEDEAGKQSRDGVAEVRTHDTSGRDVTFGFSRRRLATIAKGLARCDDLVNYEIGGRSVGDSGDGMNYLVSQLAYIEATMLERLYQPAQFRDFLPIRQEAGVWAESIRYQLLELSGHAKLINPRSNGDIPRADIATGFVEQQIITPAIGYQYTVIELAQSSYLRQPLDVSRARAAREGAERTMNQVALFGREYGPTTVDGVSTPGAPVTFPGLYNFTTNKVDGSSFTMFHNATITGAWNYNPITTAAGTATPLTILADVNAILNQAWVNSGFNIWPDILLLPPSVQAALDQPINVIGGDSVRQWIAKNNRATVETAGKVQLKIQSAIGLDDTSQFVAGAVSGTRRMIAYNSSPDNISFWIPQGLLFLPPTYERLMVTVDGYARCSAGIQLRQPTTAIYADGL